MFLSARCFVVGFFAVVGLLFSALVAAATETIPAIEAPGTVAPNTWLALSFTGCNAGTYPTAAACGDRICGPGRTLVSSVPSWDGKYLNLSYTGSCSVQVYPSCPGGSTKTNDVSSGPKCVTATSYSCPANEGWVLNGSTCEREACEVGQARYGGVCKNSCPYPGSGGPRTGSAYSGEGAAPVTLCLDGCNYGKRYTVLSPGVGWASQAGPSLGTSCSVDTAGVDGNGDPIEPAEVTTAPPETAADAVSKCMGKGQGWGTVGGIVVCSGTAGVETETVEESRKELTSDPSGPTESETTKKTTVCKDGVCETTTETTKDNGTGTGGNSGADDGTSIEVGTVKESDVAFCAANPTDFKCTGKTESDQAKFCVENPDSVSCMSAGTPSDGSSVVGTKSAGVSVIGPVALSVDMTCPPPVELPYGMSVSWSPLCDAAGMLRPLVLLFAWLGAGLLVVGGVKSGG